MTLDDQLRSVLHEEADLRIAAPPDVPGLIRGGRARRRRRHGVLAGGAVLAAVIAAGGVYGLAQLGGDADSAGEIAVRPTPHALPDIGGAVALDPGTYEVPAGVNVVAPYTVTVPAGWVTQYGNSVGKHMDKRSGTGIEPFVLDRIRLTDDACNGPEALGMTQSSTTGLVAGLRAQGSGPRVTDPVAATVGGLPATRFDLGYPGSEPLRNCRLAENVPDVERGALQIWSGYLVMYPAESASVYVVDVGGRSQVLVAHTADDASAADRAELQSILDSISFQTGAD